MTGPSEVRVLHRAAPDARHLLITPIRRLQPLATMPDIRSSVVAMPTLHDQPADRGLDRSKRWRWPACRATMRPSVACIHYWADVRHVFVLSLGGGRIKVLFVHIVELEFTVDLIIRVEINGLRRVNLKLEYRR